MIEYLKSAAAIAVAACILLGALLFAHSKIRKDGISDSADAAGATTSAAASSDHKERLELVRELCARTGIDEPRLTRVLDSQASPSVPLAPSALPVPTRESSRAGEAQATRGPSAYEVIDAVQFALEAAGRDDDYGSIGVEHEADDGPQQIELTLLDWKQRDRAELLTKLIANAQDISVEKRFAPQRGVLEALIERLSVGRDEALADMSMVASIDIPLCQDSCRVRGRDWGWCGSPGGERSEPEGEPLATGHQALHCVTN